MPKENDVNQCSAVAYCNSKIILIGEHSVVFGKPAIAFPFPVLRAESVVTNINGNCIQIVSQFYSGPLQNVPENMNGVRACIEQTLAGLNKRAKEGLQIKINSTIPVGRGLGSSAATAIAMIRSLFNYYNEPLSNNQLFALAQIAESYAHGTPSGIDMKAAASSHPIWFQKNKEPIELSVSFPFHILIADTGRAGGTRKAVQSIQKNALNHPDQVNRSMVTLEHLAYEARDALRRGNARLLGNTLDAAQKELELLGVSDSGIDHLIHIAKSAGALGAKLTGGGRGGCIIALVEERGQAKRVASQLLEGGAKQIWMFNLKGEER